MRVWYAGVGHVARERIDIPGNTVEASGAVIAIGDGIAAVRAEAGVSTRHSDRIIGSGKGAADQPGGTVSEL